MSDCKCDACRGLSMVHGSDCTCPLCDPFTGEWSERGRDDVSLLGVRIWLLVISCVLAGIILVLIL